jgi:hypothetical protein
MGCGAAIASEHYLYITTKAIATEFPGTPHRYCHNHFLRDVAQPVLEMDSRAKVKMRRHVRGLRAIERRVLEDRRLAAAPASTPPDERAKTEATPLAAASEAATVAPCASSDLGLPATDSALEATGVATTGEALVEDEMGEVVLGYCAAVRGILNDSQGGPLHPPGVRMRQNAPTSGNSTWSIGSHTARQGLTKTCSEKCVPLRG